MAFNPASDEVWLKREKGDIAVFFRWVDDEPCMTLYPRYASAEMKPTGVDLTLSIAYTLADSVTGAPTAGLLQRLERAAKTMGMFPDKFTLHRLADVIADSIPDLLAMPPFPPSRFVDDRKDKEVLGEGLIKVAGKEIYRGEVTAGDLKR